MCVCVFGFDFGRPGKYEKTATTAIGIRKIQTTTYDLVAVGWMKNVPECYKLLSLLERKLLMTK